MDGQQLRQEGAFYLRVGGDGGRLMSEPGEKRKIRIILNIFLRSFLPLRWLIEFDPVVVAQGYLSGTSQQSRQASM